MHDKEESKWKAVNAPASGTYHSTAMGLSYVPESSIDKYFRTETKLD